MIEESKIPPEPQDVVPSERAERGVSRPFQILAGLSLGAFTIFCGFALVTSLAVPAKQSPIFAVIVALILLLGCVWILEKCVRLLTGHKNRGGLMSPTTLRVISFFFLGLPIAGLFTGYYRTMGPIAVIQAVAYITIFFGLRRLARTRETRDLLNEHAKSQIPHISGE
jgi:hypothetical protein